MTTKPLSLTDEVARRAEISVRWAHGLFLVEATDAAAFLDACLAAEVVVLGIEGFLVDENHVVPQMGAIADFSGIDDVRKTNRAARDFVAEVGTPGMFFEFVLTFTP